MQLNIPMFTTLGLSGEPFVGSDVGGFIGRGNGELLVRSYQVSFLAPFCRNHKVIDGYDQEPWRFGKHYEDIIRKYLKLRYQLLPFLYTTLEEAHRTGVPLFRPLVLNYQDDANTYNLDDQFMIGNDLLVAPIVKPDVTRRLVYLPKGVWYDYWTNKKYEGGNDDFGGGAAGDCADVCARWRDHSHVAGDELRGRKTCRPDHLQYLSGRKGVLRQPPCMKTTG